MAYLNEHNFVIASLKALRQPQFAEQAAALSQTEMDWSYILNFLSAHHLRVLFFESVSRHKSIQVPADSLQMLKQFAFRNLHKNGYLMHELVGIVRALAEQNISVVPFKGVVLSQQLYQGLGQREIDDLDILVHKEDLLRVVGYLSQQGFVGKSPIPSAVGAIDRIDHYHISLTRQEPDLTVELHWMLARHEFSKLSHPSLFWNNLTAITSFDQTMQTVEMQIFVIFSCMHAFKHSWRRLAWIYDIAQILYQFPDLNWKEILETAEELHGKQIVLQGLCLAHEIFAVPLPEVVHKELHRARATQQGARSYQKQIIAYPVTEPAIPNFILQFGSRQGWRDRMKFVQTKFRPNEHDSELIPHWTQKGIFLYAARFYRLTAQYVFPWLKDKWKDKA